MTIVQALLQLPFLPSEWSSLQKGNALFTLSFLFITLLLFLFILFSRLRDGLRFANERWMIKKSQQVITTYMFNEDLEETYVDHFKRKYLRNYTQREIFLRTLLQLQKNIVGELADRLSLLYLEAGLHAHSKRKLYSGSWSRIADGINELAEMDIYQDLNLIRAFINHYNQELRSVAQVAVLRLQKSTPFLFLDELQGGLREWQQVQLANAAHKAHMDMPAFKRWLTKEEPSIVIFCIRMIAEHNQLDAVGELVALLGHPDRNVRTKAIEAICSLEAFEAKDKLVELYDRESTDVKLEILKTLAVIGDDGLLPFYEKVMASPEKRLQLEAANFLAGFNDLADKLLQPLHDLESSFQAVTADDLRAAV